MMFHALLPMLVVLLMTDTKKAKPFLAQNGDILTVHYSPWRFFAAKRCCMDNTDDIFMVRFFRGKSEWSVQFENISKDYSFSRYCAEQNGWSLYQTLKLLLSDAKYGFTLPF